MRKLETSSHWKTVHLTLLLFRCSIYLLVSWKLIIHVVSVFITLSSGLCIIAFHLCLLIAANDIVIKSQGTIKGGCIFFFWNPSVKGIHPPPFTDGFSKKFFDALPWCSQKTIHIVPKVDLISAKKCNVLIWKFHWNGCLMFLQLEACSASILWWPSWGCLSEDIGDELQVQGLKIDGCQVKMKWCACCSGCIPCYTE